MDKAQLIARRKLMGLTRAQLARRLGMTNRGYAYLETGGRKVRTIHRLAIERIEQIRVEEIKRDLADVERRESEAAE